MKIPTKLKIGGHLCDIIYDDTYKEHGDTHAGTTIPAYTKIFISTIASKSVQEETLIHEIIEFINNGNDLQLSHQSISTLGECLYQVLKDNKLIN